MRNPGWSAKASAGCRTHAPLRPVPGFAIRYPQLHVLWLLQNDIENHTLSFHGQSTGYNRQPRSRTILSPHLSVITHLAGRPAILGYTYFKHETQTSTVTACCCRCCSTSATRTTDISTVPTTSSAAFSRQMSSEQAAAAARSTQLPNAGTLSVGKSRN